MNRRARVIDHRQIVVAARTAGHGAGELRRAGGIEVRYDDVPDCRMTGVARNVPIRPEPMMAEPDFARLLHRFIHS
jgi:hypothetical protein